MKNTESIKEFAPIVLTGERPTGKLHLGHYVGSIQNRLKLQDEYDTCFYMVADVQALTDNADNPEKVRDNVLEVVLDNMACGLDPEKTVIFAQSMVPEIAELTVFFMNLVTVNQLTHNPTIKTEIAQRGFEESLPLGFLAYPVSQAADILFAKSTIIPVGDDQIPVIEVARDIAKKFNAIYGEVFPLPEALLSETPRLVGIKGEAKASKSLGNAIMLSDSDEEIAQKVMDMYTDPNRLKKTDPGHVEGNVVFAYLDIFDERSDEIQALKDAYQAGGEEAPGDVELKQRLIEVLQGVIGPIRARREELTKDMDTVRDILRDGTERAREHARATMAEVRKAMKIDYLS